MHTFMKIHSVENAIEFLCPQNNYHTYHIYIYIYKIRILSVVHCHFMHAFGKTGFQESLPYSASHTKHS